MKSFNWNNVETNFTDSTAYSPRLKRQLSPRVKKEGLSRGVECNKSFNKSSDSN